MNKKVSKIRYLIIGVVLVSGLIWSAALAQKGATNAGYPNGDILASADWLKRHLHDRDLVVVDVRTDAHFDGRLIPGAIRMPWSLFRYNDKALNLGEVFIGIDRAQTILGEHGIGRTNTIVLYDSVARDGAATASYLFWVLEVLGHRRKKILEGGIDAWSASGYDMVSKPETLSPILYQARLEEIHKREIIDGDFVYKRLGDPYYQIIDVRSREEYLGQKGTRDLYGRGLKLGHIPTAVNVNYELNWKDKSSKKIKPYRLLQELYRGLDSDKTVIVYCNSGRRSSFSYFVLKLMGFENIITYEPSWKEWGNPENFYPVETTERKFAEGAMPQPSQKKVVRKSTSDRSNAQSPSSSGKKPKGGYVSCGG